MARALKAGFGAGAILVSAWLAFVPAAYLVWNAFTDADGLTFAHLTDAYGSDRLGELAWNSAWFTLGTTLVTVPLGAALAFLVVRTDLPLRRTIFALAVVPLVVPGVVSTIGWILVASPRTGLVNALLGHRAPLTSSAPLGMVLVESAQSLPLVFLLMAGAFAIADGTLEEAAAVSGARPTSVLRRVTLPMAAPAAGRVGARRRGANARVVRGAGPARPARRRLGADVANLARPGAPASGLRRGGCVRAGPGGDHRARRLALLAHGALRGRPRRRCPAAPPARWDGGAPHSPRSSSEPLLCWSCSRWR